MGCTSSAPNMTPSIATSEKDRNISSEMEEQIMEEEKEVAHEKGLESNGIKALPCDTVDESTLDSNNKSNHDTSSDHPKDSHGNGHVMDSENENNSSNDPDTNTEREEEKLSSLENVVEKVVELYENGVLEIKGTETEDIKDSETQMHTSELTEDKPNEQKQDDTVDNEEEEESQDPVSPSQSQCSRATRWEALADIAAELPPSLAVDPVTGQIYALSK